MADLHNYYHLPEAVAPPSPWDRESRDTISSGLHVVCPEWDQGSFTPSPSGDRSSGLGENTVGDPLPAWLVHRILEVVDSAPRSSSAWRDQVASALYRQHLQEIPQGCHCDGRHPSGPPQVPGGNCSWCRTKSMSKSMLGHIRRALSTAANTANKRFCMPRRNVGRHLRCRTNDLSDLSKTMSPSKPPAAAAYQTAPSELPYLSNSSPAQKTPLGYPGSRVELSEEYIFELHDTTIPAMLSADSSHHTQHHKTCTATPTQQVPAPHASTSTQWTLERNFSGDSMSSVITPDRSVSIMSDASARIQGNPARVSNSSVSTASSGLTRISTDLPTFGAKLYDSPIQLGEMGVEDIAPWNMVQGPLKQASWNSTSTTVQTPSVGMGSSPAQTEWHYQERPSNSAPFSTSLDEYLELDQLPSLPPPYSPMAEPNWDEPPAYSLLSLPQQAHISGTQSNSYPIAQMPQFGTAQEVSQPVLIAYPLTLNFHEALLTPPSRILDRTNPYISSQASIHRPPFSHTPVPTQQNRVYATRRGTNPGLSAENNGFPYEPLPLQSLPDLPSVRKVQRARQTSLRRRTNRPRRRPKPGPTCCESCSFFPVTPGIQKKMRRHMATDCHRRATGQEPVEKVTCQHIEEDGSVCGKPFNRRDNLRQHCRNEHETSGSPPDGYGLIEDEDVELGSSEAGACSGLEYDLQSIDE